MLGWMNRFQTQMAEHVEATAVTIGKISIKLVSCSSAFLQRLGRTRARTHTHTRARTHTHTRTHAHADSSQEMDAVLQEIAANSNLSWALHDDSTTLCDRI